MRLTIYANSCLKRTKNDKKKKEKNFHQKTDLIVKELSNIHIGS